jgi:predicted Zn-ribbon and HTH transcriptional regulator
MVGFLDDMVPKPRTTRFSDFTQGWFANVGAALVMTMLIQNGTPPTIQCLKARAGRTKQDKVIEATKLMEKVGQKDDKGKRLTRHLGRCGKPCATASDDANLDLPLVCCTRRFAVTSLLAHTTAVGLQAAAVGVAMDGSDAATRTKRLIARRH